MLSALFWNHCLWLWMAWEELFLSYQLQWGPRESLSFGHFCCLCKGAWKLGNLAGLLHNFPLKRSLASSSCTSSLLPTQEEADSVSWVSSQIISSFHFLIHAYRLWISLWFSMRGDDLFMSWLLVDPKLDVGVLWPSCPLKMEKRDYDTFTVALMYTHVCSSQLGIGYVIPCDFKRNLCNT